MTRHARRSAVALLLLAILAQPVLGDQEYLYTPKPAQPGERHGTEEILVREMTIRHGDTLSGISRRFSGRGSYYPQILLFNDIKNPNRIYAGETIRVPLGRGKKDAGADAGSRKTDHPAPVAQKKGNGRQTAAKSSARTSRGPAADTVSAPTAPPAAELSASENAPHGGGEKRTKKAGRRKDAAVPVAGVGREPGQQTAKRQSAKGGGSGSVGGAAEGAGQKLYKDALDAYRQDNFTRALDLFGRYLSRYPDSELAADASLYKAECYMKLSGQ
jgi:nucleoid-associated protein YgaU